MAAGFSRLRRFWSVEEPGRPVRARRASRLAVESLEGRELLTGGTVLAFGAGAPPVVSLALEGGAISERGGEAVVTASLSTASTQAVTVNLGFGGTARNLVNYRRSGDAITIPAGQLSGSVRLSAVDDLIKTDDLRITVSIAGVTNAVASSGAGPVAVTIQDANFTPTLIVGDVTVDKNARGTRDATFTVLLSNVSGQTVSVHYATADGTGEAADHDYLPVSGVLTFAPGETQKTVTVPVVGDTILEPDETFYLVLSGATNTRIVRPQGTCTILNNFAHDHGLWSFGAFQFTAPLLTVPAAAGQATVQVVRTDGDAGAVSVRVQTTGGNAVAGVNYVATTTTLNFADGETRKTVTIPVLDNGPPAGGRAAVALVLSDPGGGATLGAQAVTALVILSSAKPAVTVQTAALVTDASRNVARVVLTVSGDLNLARAQTTTAYRLAIAGRTGLYDGPGAIVLPVASAVYDRARRTIVLTPSRPFSLTKPVQLRISGLTDAFGRPVADRVFLLTRNGVTALS